MTKKTASLQELERVGAFWDKHHDVRRLMLGPLTGALRREANVPQAPPVGLIDCWTLRVVPATQPWILPRLSDPNASSV
jgi:hypothetical protein